MIAREPEGKSLMRLSIDPELCATTNQCVYSLPQAFAVRDGDGVGTVIDPDPPEHLRTELLEVVRSCPSQAIALED